jgi:hypothetical protein
MSRILRRPMFRGGGTVDSYGKGITAPLVPGYMGGGSINTPRRGLVSLPGGYAGEEKSLSQKIADMFGNLSVGTSGGKIPNTKKFTTSAATTDGSTTGGELIDKNVEAVIPGVYEPKDKADSDAYTDFKINKPEILSETEIQEKVDLGKSDVSNQPWWMLGLPPMIDGLGAGNYLKNKAYDQSEAGKKEYKDELTTINEENKKLYEKYKIPYEGDVSGNKVPPSLRGDGRDKNLEEKILTDYYANKEDGINEPEISPEISAKDAIAENQALFAELLGSDKARGQDISDMLLRFSGSGGDTIGEKFQNYVRAESAAGPSRSEKIKQTAAGLAINDYVAGKRAKEAVNLMKSRVDYTQDAKSSALALSTDDSPAMAKAKAAKLAGDKSINSDEVTKILIQEKVGPSATVTRTKFDLEDLKDLSPKKKDKLTPGYKIVDQEGTDIIVYFDGQDFEVKGTIDQFWSS